MALTSWTGARVRRADAVVAKNYPNGDELDLLNRLTTGFLDFAELRARNRQQTRMTDWVEQTDRFLAFNEQSLLRAAGQVSRETMEKVIEERFAAFEAGRRAAEAETAEQEAGEELEALMRQAGAIKP